MDVRIRWSQLRRPFEVIDGFRSCSFSQENLAQKIPRVSIVWTACEHCSQLLQRLASLAVQIEHRCQRVSSPHVIRV